MRQIKNTLLFTAVSFSISAVVNAQTPNAKDDSESLGLDVMIVTAERREESAQDIGTPINAFDGEGLIDRRIVSPQDVSRLTPALTVAPSIGGYTQVNIRGVGSFSANSYAEPAVSVNLGGVYLARPAAVNALFYDLERVEILKGPQGTLYGRNASAGAVNVIPKAPDYELGGSFGIDVGNEGFVQVDAALNVPLSDSVAMRIAGQSVQRDGYFSDGYDDEDIQAVRGQLLLEPSDSLRVLISADYAKQEGMGPASVAVPFVDSDDERVGPSTALGNSVLAPIGILPLTQDDGFVDNTYYGISTQLDWDTDLGTLTLIPAYRRTKLDFLTYPGFPLTDKEDAKQVTFEARFATDDSKRLSAVMGLYYFNESNDSLLTFDLGQFVTFGEQDLPTLDTESYAAFAEATYDLTDRFRLIAGLRFTRDEKEQRGTRLGPIQGPCIPPSVADNGLCISPVEGEEDFEKVTWKAGFEVDVGDQSLVYGNVATGFKAGGFFASLAPNTFEPENLTAVTLGSKNILLDDRMQLNVEAFHWRYRDQHTSFTAPVLPSGLSVVTRNIGRSEANGLDLDLKFLLTDNDVFTTNIQYLDTENKSFDYDFVTLAGPPITACDVSPVDPITVNVDCSGREMLLAPEFSGNVTYLHRFNLGSGANIELSAIARFATSHFLQLSYLDDLEQDSYTMGDILLKYEAANGAYSISAYVNNVTDETISVGGEPQPVIGVPYNFLAPPRTYGVRLRAQF